MASAAGSRDYRLILPSLVGVVEHLWESVMEK